MLNKEKTKRDGSGEKKQWRIWVAPDKLCSVGVYIFLFVFVAIYSFYAPEGYIQIATNKYRFFRKMCLITAGVMIPLIILRYILSMKEKDVERGKDRISITDIYMLLFLLINIISYYFTAYREEALWGTSGWYMGFAMHLFFVGIYFMISRLYDRKIEVLPLFMGITGVVFLWGLLNRFSVYPIDMQYDSPSFISSMGNINWFCGYWSVFFVIGVVLYIVAEKRSLRILSGIYSALALAIGAVEGSDSAYISMGVVFFFLFLVSFRKTEYMKRWLEECVLFCGVCQIMRVIAAFGPEEITPEYTGWRGLNLINPTIKLMLGNLTVVALIIFILLQLGLERADKKFAENNGSGKNAREEQWIGKVMWLKHTVTGLIAAVAIIYLILLIINTRTPGILGPLSKYKVLLFDGSWGSSRGATWRDGLLTYQTMGLRERLTGVGQDCFSIYGYSVPELEVRYMEEWQGSRLTNAHNECITYLVNLGIFGMLAFIGIFVSSVKRLLANAKREPLCYVYAASLMSYFFHNQFSFSQVLNIPFIFMMLGLGENLMRSMEAGENK